MTMQLREEFLRSKKEKERIMSEAAVAWLSKNVVLLTEDIDRKTVKKLVNSIQKFDDTFGPYKMKIPTISVMIDSAEDGLQKVLTGNMNSKKASDMLKRLSFLYSTFSKFFSDDLPLVMSSHLFRAAKEFPDVKMNVLQPTDGTKHDPSAIRDALKNALEPSKEELKFIRKIYRSKNIPFIDSVGVSNEMINLSFNELQELTGAGKVPMVATPGEEEADLSLGGTEEEAAGLELGEVVPPKKESVDRTQKKAINESSMIKESHSLLLEMNQKEMDKMVNVINQLKNNFNIPGMENINSSLEHVLSAARRELAANKWTTGKAVKQLVAFYNLMDNLNQQWPKISQLFSDNTVDETEQNDLKQLLNAAMKDTVFQSLAKAFKLSTPHAIGLDPNSVTAAIMDAVSKEGGLEAVTNLFQKSQGLPSVDKEGAPKISGKASTGESKPPATAAPASKAKPAVPAAGVKTKIGSAQAASSQDYGAYSKDIASKLKLPAEQASNYEDFMNQIAKAGYSVVPKG